MVTIDTSTLTRALYSSDASLYRVVPRGVVIPRTADELGRAVDAALAERTPITLRGAGTSCAGNAVGPGLVLATANHLTAVLDVDPERALAVVEPGVVAARLNAVVAGHGYRFGPDPSTADRCTIGGMLGNNACGPRALGYGRTSDNVIALDVIAGTGERLALDSRVDLRTSESPLLRALWALVRANLGVIRTEFGRFPRQVSGYALEHLLPENGFDVTRFLVGSEGTLAVVTRATLRLVPTPAHRCLVILGYPSLAAAADRMPDVLPSRPTACEGLDERLMAAVRERQGSDAVPVLPAGRAWLFVELGDADPDTLARRAADLVAAAGPLEGRVLLAAGEAERWWRLRADAAGYAAVALPRPAHAGWEDAAVPPERLGDYLRDFEDLLARHGLHGLPYGHFGEGCVHCRIDFPLESPDGAGRYRRFIEEAAALVASHAGSMSGEHGDGRARSELLPLMYSPAALRLFAQIKALFDPHNLLNPGVLVDPRPLDVDLRIPQVGPLIAAGGLASEVHRCTGVGRCVVTSGDGAMCPSYRVTGEEKDSTRGRARVLQEMVNGSLVTGGARSPEVLAALDLCLACKACARECPTGVDLADYKSRVLADAYRGRLRPASHYLLGRLPRWGAVISATPGLARIVNAAMALGPLRRALLRLGGLDPSRRLPRFADRPAARRGKATTGPGRPVLVWVDSFSDAFEGDQASALLRVLAAAGYAPRFLGGRACCGLPLISTGQRDAAAAELRRALDVLHPPIAEGIPVVALEPSCLAVWRSDAAGLVDDPRVADVAAGVLTLAELLARTPAWRPPDLSGHELVVQPHCHHAAVLGWSADAALLRSTGASVVTVAGCCGLAGNFGMEAGHAALSRAVFADRLGPALDAAGPDAIVLADGFSCRTQIADLAGRQALTLAELLAVHG